MDFLKIPPSTSIDDILKKLEELKDVKKVRFQKLENTDYFDVFFFPLCMGKNRIMMLTDKAFLSIKQHLIELLGTGGESILFNEGIAIGDVMLKSMPTSLKTSNEKLNFLKNLIRATGWGIIEYHNLNTLGRTGEIHVYDNIEADPRYGKRCHLSRGVLTSFMRHIFENERLTLLEMECMGLGSSKCVFKLV